MSVLFLVVTASKAAQVEKASPEKWLSNASIFSDSSLRNLTSKRDNSLNFELMDDFIEMERLAESQSQSHSVSGSENTTETPLFLVLLMTQIISFVLLALRRHWQ